MNIALVGSVVEKMTISKIITGALFAGVMAFGASSANATTVTDGGYTQILGEGTGTFTNVGSDAIIDIDWTETAFTGTYEFTTSVTFDLFFTDYRNDTEDQGLSAFVLRTDGVNISQEDLSCNAAAPFDGTCQLIAEDGVTGPQASAASTPSSTVPLFEGLAAGTYLIGIRDSSTPEQGGVSSAVSTIPLPAGLVLFLSGLGILGFASRRKA